MDATAEAYLRLGLRLGRHVDGVVDAYYGPPELAAEVDAEPLVEPAQLVEDGDALVASLEESWLLDQARGLRTYAGMLAGEELSYADEVERCYGVRPRHEPEDGFAGAHERLEELLPGPGTLAERFEAWREGQTVPRDRLLDLLAALVAHAREVTARHVELPEGEEIELDVVTDEPWLAFNYYLGGLRSRVVANIDLPVPVSDLLLLGPHETYPGHHTERMLKERLLVEGRGVLDETIVLVPTPQSVLSEGIAEAGWELVAEKEDDRRVTEILSEHGLEVDVAHTREVLRVREWSTRVSVNAALMLHDGGATREEAAEYIAHWAARSPERAAKSVDFLLDPTWRAYAISYAEGGRLVRAYANGDVDRFRRLLTEQVRVRDLVAAADGGTSVSSGA